MADFKVVIYKEDAGGVKERATTLQFSFLDRLNLASKWERAIPVFIYEWSNIFVV